MAKPEFLRCVVVLIWCPVSLVRPKQTPRARGKAVVAKQGREFENIWKDGLKLADCTACRKRMLQLCVRSHLLAVSYFLLQLEEHLSIS